MRAFRTCAAVTTKSPPTNPETSDSPQRSANWPRQFEAPPRTNSLLCTPPLSTNATDPAAQHPRDMLADAAQSAKTGLDRVKREAADMVARARSEADDPRPS